MHDFGIKIQVGILFMCIFVRNWVTIRTVILEILNKV